MTATLEKYVPVLSRRGGTFPAGAESWAATDQRVALSSAEQAAGAVPNTPIDAQSLNHLLGVLGEHLDALIDAPSFNWAVQPVEINNAFATGSGAGTGFNRNEPDDPPLIMPAGENWIVNSPGGATGVCFYSWEEGRGGQLGNDADTNLFVACQNSGVGAGATLSTNAYTNRILASNGTVKYTDDYGATWSAGGTQADQPSTGGLYRSTRWVAVHSYATGSFLIEYSSTLSGSWTVAADLTGVDADSYFRTITNGNTCIFLPGTCGSSSDLIVDTGSGFAKVTVSGAGASSGWRGCYHDLLDKYFITNLAGKLYSSSTGTSWALEATLGSGIYDIAPHGRGLVISTETEDFTGPATTARLTYVSWNRDQALTERHMPWETPALSYPRFHLIRHRGRCIAARLMSSETQTDRIEYWFSHVHPAHLIAASGL